MGRVTYDCIHLGLIDLTLILGFQRSHFGPGASTTHPINYQEIVVYCTHRKDHVAVAFPTSHALCNPASVGHPEPPPYTPVSPLLRPSSACQHPGLDFRHSLGNP